MRDLKKHYHYFFAPQIAVELKGTYEIHCYNGEPSPQTISAASTLYSLLLASQSSCFTMLLIQQ